MEYLTLDDSTVTDSVYCETAFAVAAPVIACTAAEDARGFSINSNGIRSGTTATVTSSTLEGGRTSELVMAIEYGTFGARLWIDTSSTSSTLVLNGAHPVRTSWSTVCFGTTRVKLGKTGPEFLQP